MPANVKVLLVDDNPMVLEMLRQGLTPMATIQTAPDGADALLKVVDDLPDLIVTDFDMPGMNGRQLLEKVKARAATARVPIILLASKGDITEKLTMVRDTVEDFIEKPFFTKEACTHIKRVIDRIALEKLAREAPGESQLRGSLAQMSIMDLLQSLEMGRKSCLLTVSYNGGKCDMYFVEGQVSHAQYGNVKGDDAVYKVVGWNDGTFTIDFTKSTNETSCTRSTQGLLMEGLRMLDESNRDGE
jgi:CheY-like chemotaxis protein